MSEQGALFAPVSNKAGTHERVCGQPILAGNTDAATSHEAAAGLVRSGAHARKCLEALAILAAWVGPPPTAMDLARGDEARRVFLCKRLADCAALSRLWAEPGEPRIDRRTGRAQQTWRMTSAGFAALRGRM